MEPLSVVIAEDERLARRALLVHLERFPFVRVVAECANGRSALAAVRREQPDALLLDIEMPGLTGFELLEELDPAHAPAVVFITAYDRALHAFQVGAVDYVLKPFDTDRLAAALERVRQRIRPTGPAEADMPSRRAPARRLMVRDRNRVFPLRVDAIDWIEAVGNYVRLHTPSGTHLVRRSMADLEMLLDPSEFVRIHRSTLVNLARVHHIEPYGASDYQAVLHSGIRLRVARGRRDRLLRGAH